MDCLSIIDAGYLDDLTVWLRFYIGESGEVDLGNTIFRFAAASPLRNPDGFSKFHPDERPTVAWNCGFDVDPEHLYEIVSGKHVLEPQEYSQHS